MTPTQPVTLTSVLTCPVCQHAQAEQMPTDACQWFLRMHQLPHVTQAFGRRLLRVLLLRLRALPAHPGTRQRHLWLRLINLNPHSSLF